MIYLNGKRVLMVLGRDNFQDEEYTRPRQALEEAGAEVEIAGSNMALLRGMLGGTARATHLLEKVDVHRFDGIVFVGGPGADEFSNHPQAHQLARTFLEEGKVVAASSFATLILANAGILKGRTCTAFSSVEARCRARGANCTGKPLERDGKLLTCNGPEAAVKFADALVELLNEL